MPPVTGLRKEKKKTTERARTGPVELMLRKEATRGAERARTDEEMRPRRKRRLVEKEKRKEIFGCSPLALKRETKLVITAWTVPIGTPRIATREIREPTTA